MSGQRISLSRILAIHWYGFRQILDVENHTLIAGAFGTGKTALLDLMQHVLLGEHWRPNRAAAGNARSRSLVSYCLCDTNTLRDGEPHYTRSSGVTVIGLEFTWPAATDRAGKPVIRRETWGMRIEYSSATAEARRTYFLIPDRVGWENLAPDGRMLGEEEFRTWVRREFEVGSQQRCLFGRQVDYLAEMATPRHLHFDLLPFQRTLEKSIAFEPEEKVEDFIRRFILEESPLDVRDVKAAQDAYRETEARLRRQEDEATYLRRIRDLHARFESAAAEESIQSYLRIALELAQVEEKRQRMQAELVRLQTEQVEDREANLVDLKALTSVTQILEEVRREAFRDRDQARLDELQRHRDELQAQIADLREASLEVRKRLVARHQHWTQWLRHADALPVEGLAGIVRVDAVALESLRIGDEPARLTALQELANQFQTVHRAVEGFLQPLVQTRDEAEKRLRQLAADLESIGKERSPGSFPVFEAVQARIGGRAHQLGRLIEVKPDAERWWPALEWYLGHHRWAIVVSGEDYREALDVVRRTAPGREPEVLLHPTEVMSPKLRRDVRAGCLAEKVDVTHSVARAYVLHLLGDVACVENAEDLERNPSERAITADGVLKQLPTRRRTRSSTEIALTLGREGLARMRQEREREWVEAGAQRDAAARRIRDVNDWLDFGLRNGLGDARLPDRSGELARLPALEAEQGRTRETILLLSTPEREARLRQLRELEQTKTDLDGRIAVRRERMNLFELKARPLTEGLEQAEEEARRLQLDRAASRVAVPTSVLDRELEERFRIALKEQPNWDRRKEATAERARLAAVAAVDARNARDRERLALASVRDDRGDLLHPEYAADFSVDEPRNEAWDARLRQLETVELAKSGALATDRRRDWERRLQEGVLDRLKEKLHEADQTIRQLGQYLDRRVGRYVYRLTKKRDPGFAALWSLLDTGMSPSDPLLQAVKSKELEAAKNELMTAVDAAERADDRSRRLLDYRFYHHYDLEMANAEQPDAPAISLGRSGRSLSGGENQAPFFISMLAAFRRVYDVSSSRAPRLGLVVMDEAFSKLSGDGVEDCLELARRFELQLVMAFPIDRLGVMAPYADTVVLCRKQEERAADGYVSRLDNLPIVLPPDRIQEALE